ncbi:MAG: hypothetical protein ACI9V1_003354 [Spirosomataceae bacterium]|jgi:hypothetical protein
MMAPEILSCTERANPFRSLYSDKSAFFLTINQEIGKRKRISSINSDSPNLPEEPYHLAEDCVTYDYKQFDMGQQANISTASTRFTLDLPFENLQENTYGLRINPKDLAGNSLIKPYGVQFRVVEKELPSTLLIFPNLGVGFVQIRCTIVTVTEPKSAKVAVYNSLRKLMVETEQNAQIGESNYFIDTKQFSAGRYYAKVIINGAEIISAPFVVK